MQRVIAEFSASELPSALSRLLPDGAIDRGSRWRVVLEEISENGTTDTSVLVGVALGMADADAGRVLDEEEVFARFTRGENE